jgi:C4-type Zn-finger protein
MVQKDIFHCPECGEKLELSNWRTEKLPFGDVVWRVDYWCANDNCSRKNQLGVIESKMFPSPLK